MNKTLKTFCCALLAAVAARAESWNPYVNQAIVSPAPLMPVEFNGTGTLSFNVGNTGSDELPLVTNQEITLVITLSDGIPNHADPMSALGGTWLDKFDWTYDEAITTYRAVQNQPLPGSAPGVPSLGTITVLYKVTRNTPSGDPSNGFNVNLQPPPYSNGFNATDDDVASSYTYVRATDFGDAPAGYGSAGAEIYLFKDVDGNYLNYVFMGDSVDQEAADQPSAAANGDDLNGLDDEDGVTFPALTAGTTVTIPVVLTVMDSDFSSGGRLNAWIDWNGDGDFGDAGEKIANNTLIAASETRNLTVTIPANAITTRPTFARFRFGQNIASSGLATYGEVEDYQITIQAAPLLVTIGDRVWTDTNGNGVQDGGETGLTNVTVRLLDSTNGVVATAVTDANGNYLFANRPAATYKVEVVPPAQYVFTARDAAAATDLTDSDADPVTGRTDPVVMAAGVTNLTLDAGLFIPAVLYGNVFVDRNSDLLRNTGDASVTNTLVTLVVNGRVVASTNTLDHGYYRFENVPPGAVSVLVSRASATLIGVPQSEPAASDETRNRALPDGPGVYAYITYNVVSGYGVLASLPGEPLNFGFSSFPLSTSIGFRAFASGNDGETIEISTVNESGFEDIVVFAWINNAWVEVGRVLSKDVFGDGDHTYVIKATGIEAGASYFFKIVDESGHVHASPTPVAVETIRMGAVRFEMAEMVVTFNTQYGRKYVVKVSANLGAAAEDWVAEFVRHPTAAGLSDYSNQPFMAGPGTQTQVRIPVNKQRAFFKIVMVTE